MANNEEKMKRYGHIIEQIADMDNLREADREAQSGKVKKNRNIRRHNLQAEENLYKLRQMILTIDFPEFKYIIMTVKSENKLRTIAKRSYYPWRILDHAIMRVVGDVLHKTLINDSFACVKGKGLHFGVRRMKRMLKEHPNLAWFGKTDLKKFYESIPHDTIIRMLRRKFKDEKFIQLVSKVVLSYESNVSNELQDEENKKRGCYWSVHKSTAW